MGTPLNTLKPGGGAPTYLWLLHTSGVSAAIGRYIATGDGSDSTLWIDASGIGVRSPTGVLTKIQSGATSPNVVLLADNDGTLYPEDTRRTTGSVNNSTVTPTGGIATELSYTPEAGGLYEFELVAIMQSAATTTGLRIDLVGPAQITAVSWQSRGPGATTTTLLVVDGAGLPAQFLGTAVPVAAASNIVSITGKFLVTGAPVSAMQVQIYSEIAASQVTLLAGSSIRYRKLN